MCGGLFLDFLYCFIDLCRLYQDHTVFVTLAIVQSGAKSVMFIFLCLCLFISGRQIYFPVLKEDLCRWHSVGSLAWSSGSPELSVPEYTLCAAHILLLCLGCECYVGTGVWGWSCQS